MKLDPKLSKALHACIAAFLAWAIIGIFLNSKELSSVSVSLLPGRVEHKDKTLLGVEQKRRGRRLSTKTTLQGSGLDRPRYHREHADRQWPYLHPERFHSHSHHPRSTPARPRQARERRARPRPAGQRPVSRSQLQHPNRVHFQSRSRLPLVLRNARRPRHPHRHRRRRLPRHLFQAQLAAPSLRPLGQRPLL